MKHQFQIIGLDSAHFVDLMHQSDAVLKSHNAYWLIADESPAYPCRVSLKDAEIGERVLACNFQHHAVNTPYRASGPIFIREGAVTADLEVNQIPQVLHNRQLSLRAYAASQLMVDACVVTGSAVTEAIENMFADSDVAYIQIHNAGPGCFSCEVKRVTID